MLTKTAIVALALSTAVPAFAAEPVSQGDAMLAQIAGVEPGVYSTPDLITLTGENSDTDDRFKANYILEERGNGVAGRAQTSAQGYGVSHGHAQLANQLRVSAADFTLPQLIRLDDAVADNNRVQVQAILSEAGVSTPAAQLLR